MERIPSADKIFEDVRFRNWVNEVGLVVPVPQLEDVELQVKAGQHLTKTERRIVKCLQSEPGHFLPDIMLDSLHSSAEKPENLDHWVDINIFRLKAKIDNGDIIYNGSKLGIGLGIMDYSFKPPETARLVYCLYKFFDTALPNETVADILYADEQNDPRLRAHYLTVTKGRFNHSILKGARVKLQNLSEELSLNHRNLVKLTWAD